ncbi:hypothetical protein BGZ98_004944 [Dissophora globulifera]|nr:hypothetical protein BGZ98_004944 [Dissophora globulifera]
MSSRPDEQQLQADASISTFTSALIFNAAVGLVIFIVFGIVRHWSKKIYQPRTYLVTEDARAPELGKGYFSWITASFAVKDHDLVGRIGLDAYMFLRFMRMGALLFSVFTLVGIPFLIPINVINGLNTLGQPIQGLLIMTIGNVNQSWRFWFHLVLTVLFSAGTVIMLWSEMYEYTRRRHAYLLSKKHSKTPQATTILVTAIPRGLNNEEALHNIFSRFPGGVRRIWLNKNPKDLMALCDERDSIALKLEAAENAYIRSAYAGKKDKETQEPERPIGRLSSIPFVGEKVDLINAYTERLQQLNNEIKEKQEAGSKDSLNSAFIQFHTQFAAHSAVQTVVHPTPFRMAPMYSEISPLDVVWDNMNLDTITRKVRTLISLIAATALVLLWSIPVVFVSTIANIDALVKLLPFLKFLKSLPASVIGIIQGILPPLFLAILMALLPIILTMMSNFEGHVRQSSITLAVMSKYFFFLVVNVLLISTLSGGFLQTFREINGQGFSPIQVINMIAQKLPAASTFFVTYAMLQGLMGPALELLQIAPLILNYVFTKLLAKSPRQVWNVQGRLPSVNYGILFPPQTLMFSIGLVYSTMSPLILPFVAFYFTVYYWVYRHQFLYVYLQPVETGGLAFPLAVKQTFVGLFIFQVTMFGIFLLNQSKTNVLPQVILMVLLIVCTGFSLSSLNEAFDPLVTFLPVALFSEEMQVDKDGAVVDDRDKSLTDDRIPDEEALRSEKASSDRIVVHSPSPPLSEKDTLAAKRDQGYDDLAEISSQLAAVPTPHASEVDSMSFSRQSLHPSAKQSVDRPVSYEAHSQKAELDVDETVDEVLTAEDRIRLEKLNYFQEQAYCHPAAYRKQIPIWLPADDRKLVMDEIEKLGGLGIEAETTGAVIDKETAKVEVTKIVFAPGEEARYRLERGE